MLNEYYPFESIIDDAHFIFKSKGNEGIVLKMVILSHIGQERWNLGFGDLNLKTGDIDDAVMSDNHDAAKVMRTVAKAAYVFLETYPNRTVFIEPVDMKRKRFYNAVFQRYYKEVEPIFDLFGLIGEISEVYSPKIIYDFFELKRKKR